MRLNQFLASAGLGSRRSVEQLIRSGRVLVNGLPADLTSRVQPDQDHVTLDGRELVAPDEFTYIIFHKPPGYTVTRADRHAQRIVYDLIPRRFRGLAYVGRLDRESEGLLLFTDDGHLAQSLLRPESGVPREYRVDTDGVVSPADLKRLREGMYIEPKVRARALEARFRPRASGGGELQLVLTEGKKREIRRLCRAIGVRVLRLRRVSFGPLRLGRLAPGDCRPLTASELRRLKQAPRAKN